MKLKKKNDGFTLVELIVVIAILAILAGVAVPAYSGYVKKAEKAGDLTLLAAVNDAFAAACMNEGTQISEIEGAALAWSETGKSVVGVASVKDKDASGYDAAFKLFYGGNEGAEFKVITENDLAFVQGVGFMELGNVPAGATYSVGYNGGYILMKSDSVNAFKDSKLAEAGVETLMNKTADIVGWAGQDLAELAGENFYSALATYMGLPADATDEEIAAKAVELAGENGSPDDIVANAMAVYAAQNATGVTLDKVSGWMGQSYTQLQENANGETLGEAAAIYALYMSYKGESFDNTAPVLNVMDTAMKDSDFKDWLTSDETKAEAQAELDAFKGAMDVIYTATDDQNATNGLLVNGFGDEELISIMQGVIGK